MKIFTVLLTLLCAITCAQAVTVTNIGIAASQSGSTISIGTSGAVPAGYDIFVFIYENFNPMPSGLTFGTLSDSAGNSYVIFSCAPVDTLSFGKLCVAAKIGATFLPSGGTITYIRYASGSPVAMSAVYIPAVGAVNCSSGSGVSSGFTFALPSGYSYPFGTLFGAGAWYGVQTYSNGSGFSNPPNYANVGSYTSLEGGNGVVTSLGTTYSATLSGTTQNALIECAGGTQSSFIALPSVVP
jgi:hypothetical protein